MNETAYDLNEEVSSMSTVRVGEEILGQFNHPHSWKNGGDSQTSHLPDTRLLWVEDLRRYSGPDPRNDAPARIEAGIRKWAQRCGLEWNEHIWIANPPRKAPYVVVPVRYFDTVLPHLELVAKARSKKK